MCPSNDGTVDGSVQASEELESESSDDSASEEDVNCAKVKWEFPRDFNVNHKVTENKIMKYAVEQGAGTTIPKTCPNFPSSVLAPDVGTQLDCTCRCTCLTQVSRKLCAV